jgi:hypothetical protein
LADINRKLWKDEFAAAELRPAKEINLCCPLLFLALAANAGLVIACTAKVLSTG